MTWTYDVTLPADLDKVRFLVGDNNAPGSINAPDATLQDEEIAFLISREPNIDMAASKAAFNLADKFALFPQDQTIGTLRITYGEITKRLIELSMELRQQRGLLDAAPTAGGIYTADKQAQKDNDALTKPFFRRNMQKFPLVPVSASQTSSNESDD